MKHIKRIGLAITFLCFTSLLIAAFIVIFRNYGQSAKKKSKANLSINFAAGN